MKKLNRYLPLFAVFSLPTIADTIPNKYLINNQLHQLANGEERQNTLSIGYYEFNQTSLNGGSVIHHRLDMAPEDGYTNTFISAKHINVPIRVNNQQQVCNYGEMGRFNRPTVTDTTSSNGTYTYTNGVLTITFDNTSVHWTDSGEDGRWDNNTPKTGNAPAGWSYQRAMGFGYFTNNLGPTGNFDFRKHFRQGNVFNSASAYVDGKKYSNIIKGTPPSTAHDWPQQLGGFKRSGATFSTRDVENGTHHNVFSSILEEDHYEQIPGQAGVYYNFHQFYQFSMVTNYYTAMPTLIYENHGHIKPTKHPVIDDGTNTVNEVEYVAGRGISEEAHYSRRCWTELDSEQTKGHNSIIFGVWDDQSQTMDKFVAVELAQTNNAGEFHYPVIVVGYSGSRDWYGDQAYMRKVLENFVGDTSMLASETARVSANNILGNDWIVELMDDNRFKIRQTISRLYFALLQRPVDSTDLTYWVSMLESNKSIHYLASALGSTEEFNSLYGGMSNTAFISKAYLNIVDRPAKFSELIYYKDLLDSGAWTRETVLLTLAESAESMLISDRRDPAALVSILLLDKAPDMTELSQNVENLKNGAEMADVVAEILYKK